MKNLKRALSLTLTVLLCFGLFILPANAASTEQATEAKVLWTLGLFKGYDESGSNFGLPDKATREQALVFLIRLLGEDKAAMAWTGATPYTDVADTSWAKPYIGYAKEKGYTQGIGDGKFGFGSDASMQQMTTFALRGLGYSDSGSTKDFTYENSISYAKTKGIIESYSIPFTRGVALRGLGYSDSGSTKDFTYENSISYAKTKGIIESDKNIPFTRGVAVDILFGSIGVNVKGQNYDLLSKLMNMGVVTQAQYDSAMAIIKAAETPASDLADGTYTMKCMGKYFRINSGKLEIRDTTPANTFTVTNKTGYSYIQTEDGKYLSLSSLAGSTQITTSSSPYKWLIKKQSSGAYTIRPYANTKMIVNANGESSNNGTKMIIWEHSNSPKHSLITIAAPSNAMVKANFKIVNNTGKSIVDLYIADSAADKYGDDFLAKNNYDSFSDDKYIMSSFSFNKATSFDFYVRYADGSEAEALGLSFAKATSAGGKVTINSSSVQLSNSSGTALSKVSLVTKVAAPVTTKDVTVTIYNLTGTQWTGLYSSSSQLSSWGSNLSSGTVTNKSSIKVIFPVSSDDYKFDLKATYSGGEYIFEGLNMSGVANNTTFYLYLSSGKPVISTTKPTTVRSITANFKNLTGKTISAAYSSSSLLNEWGSDLSGSWANDETVSIIFPVSEIDYVFDMKLMIDGEEYVIYGLDFSSVTSSITCSFKWQDGAPVLYQA